MATRDHRVVGKVLNRDTGQGIDGLIVEAWDKDLIFDDLVGSAKTEKGGSFEIRFDKHYFQECFLDRRPDLYFRIFRDGTMLHSTEDDVLWNLDTPDKSVKIEIVGGIALLDEKALARCDSGVRRLLSMSDEEIIRAVERDELRLKNALQRLRAAADVAGAGRLRPDDAELSVYPHPLFSATIIDILRRFIKIRAIVDFAGNTDDLERLGISVRSCVHNIFTVNASKHQLATLATQAATRKIRIPNQLLPQREEALAAAQIDVVQSAFLNGGGGVIVGIIDGPIDVTHEALQRPGGLTRLKYLWVQNPISGATGSSPADYFAPLFSRPEDNPFRNWTDGILYDESAINTALARGPDLTDVYGAGANQIAIEPETWNVTSSDGTSVFHSVFDHGTHTAAIAAGSRAGGLRGAAPDADIIGVLPKFSWYDSLGAEGPDAYLEDAILDSIECVQALGDHLAQPTVAYCGVGHNLGPHNGNSEFDRALDESLFSWAGRSIVIPAGNSNYDGFQTERLAHGASTSWTLSSWDDRDDLFLDIWSRGPALSVRLDVAGQTTNWLLPDSATEPAEFDGTIDAGANSFNLEVSRDAEVVSGMHNIRIHIQSFKADVPWAIGLRNDDAMDDVDVWGWVGLVGRNGTLEPHVEDEISVNDIACATSVLTVGATNKPVGDAPEESYNFEYEGTRYYPSGCGPTLDGRIKPEIVAVGKDVLSAWGGTGNDNWFMTGTSQSAALTAGAIALLLHDQPDLIQDTIKSLLIRNADQTGLHLDPLDDDFNRVERNRFGNGRLRMRPIFEDFIDPSDIDVFVRTASDDYGREPYCGECFCHAPEVQVQANDVHDPDAAHTTQVRWDSAHAISVRVHNLTNTPALATEVRLLFTRPWTAPAVWASCENGAGAELSLTLDIPPLGYQDFIFDASDPGHDRSWVPRDDQVPEVDRDWSDHFCLLVEVYHPTSGDEPEYYDRTAATVTPSEELDVWTRNIRGTNNVALRNLHIQ